MKSQPANDFRFADRPRCTQWFFQQKLHVIRRRARKLVGVFPAINYFRPTRETTFHRRYRRSKLDRCDDERVVHLRFLFDSSHDGGPKVAPRRHLVSTRTQQYYTLYRRFNDTFLWLPPRRIARKVGRSLRGNPLAIAILLRELFCNDRAILKT